jgi:hypothetical protein
MRPFGGIARMIDDNHGATGTGAARQFDQMRNVFRPGVDPALKGTQHTDIEYEYASRAGLDRRRTGPRLHLFFDATSERQIGFHRGPIVSVTLPILGSLQGASRRGRKSGQFGAAAGSRTLSREVVIEAERMVSIGRV